MLKKLMLKYFSAGLIVLSFSFFTNPSFGQDNSETARQMVEMGDEILNQTLAVLEARYIYMSAVNLDENNIRANYMAGATTLMSIDKGEATKYFLKVYELDPEYSFDILYKIGQAYHYDYKFDDAMEYYNRYKQKLAGVKEIPGNEFGTLDEAERKLYECEQGKIMVEFPEEVDIINVGPEINSSSDDYAPVVSQNEDMLIFTSRRKDDNLNPDVSEDNFPFEDIFFSTKNGESWVTANNIGQPINTLYHDSNVGLSKDGTSLFIYKDDNGGDIFMANRNAGSWTDAEPMGKPINTEFAETTVSLTPDGQTLFFASDRKGGKGGLDIWITQKNKKGTWGKPENLGDEINTPYDEDGPFIGYDGKTLYFSSAGGEGMGGYDIYRVAYDSLSEAWGAPENMGYPINTPDDDIYFAPTKDGRSAYYSSVREDGFGFLDIYMLSIPEVLQHQEQPPKVEVVLNVLVYDENNTPMDATIKMTDNTGASSSLQWKATGQYSFTTMDKEGKSYQLAVSKYGYDSQGISVTLPAAVGESSSIARELFLKKTPPPPVVEKPVVRRTPSKKLRNVYFNYNKSNLRPEYQEMVNKAVAYLNSNPQKSILLVGHSDLIGSERYNTKLSLQRAETVKKALVANGVKASRINTKGEGSTKPLASNHQEKEGRELNRRVEFKTQ
ncbi:MAG: OmpA family protein [Bacteroidota bacterium]